jgi:hypothetical protein
MRGTLREQGGVSAARSTHATVTRTIDLDQCRPVRFAHFSSWGASQERHGRENRSPYWPSILHSGVCSRSRCCRHRLEQTPVQRGAWRCPMPSPHCYSYCFLSWHIARAVLSRGRPQSPDGDRPTHHDADAQHCDPTPWMARFDTPRTFFTQATCPSRHGGVYSFEVWSGTGRLFPLPLTA